MNKRIAGWSVLVLLLGGLCFYVFNVKPQPEQAVRRANGSIVTLIAVTYGSNHMVVLGKPYQRSLFNLLPRKLKGFSGAREIRMTGSFTTNVPVFWFYDSGVASTTAPIPAGAVSISRGAPAYLPLRVLDEFGCEHEPQGYNMGNHMSGPNGSLSHYQMNLADPHCKIVGLGLYDSQSKTNEIGRFLLPGAVLKSLPAPAKEGLPPLRQDGEMTFQLTSIATGLPAEPFAYRVMRSNETLFSRATFRIQKNGGRAADWFPIRLKITDANGRNIPAWGNNGRAYHDGDDAIDFQGFLDPKDGPFKLRAEFVHRSEFSPNEQVVFTNVPFPASSESLVLTNMAAEVMGHRVVLNKFYGSFSDKSDLKFNPNFQSNQPFIRADVDPADGITHLQLLTALDESRRDIQRWGTASKSTGMTYFSFAPNSQATTATLTFAVHQSRFAEFEATPVDVRNTAISKN